MTLFLAIYGACLSTVALAWNVARARPRFKVEVVGAGGQKPSVRGETEGAVIQVKNVSEKAIFLTAIGTACKYRQTSAKDYFTHVIRYKRWPSKIGYVHLMWPEDVPRNLPKELAPGNSHVVFLPDSYIEEICIRNGVFGFMAIAQDALSRDRNSAYYEHYVDNSEAKNNLIARMERSA